MTVYWEELNKSWVQVTTAAKLMYPAVLLEEFVYLSVILESIGEKRKQIAM